jgi:voltage-gated potassium channel
VTEHAAHDTRLDRWEHASEWPLTAAALLFLGAYAWPILDTDLPGSVRVLCHTVTWATWALFAIDYGARLYLAEHRRAFIRGNLFDLLVVAVPLLRPLRLLRLVTVLAVLNRLAGDSLRGHLVTYVVGATSLLAFVAALATLESSAAPRTRTSRPSETRCGGPQPRSPPSDTATGTP